MDLVDRDITELYGVETRRLNEQKLENELGWKADENFDTGIVKTIEWYLNKYGVKK